ncbi:hypothetical protein M2475_001520 [Breznakia sp. PF5-3]|uniref:InlB B-repeat-containing protein n=1 Tax=unclassified Breznakia TaxID=2623764 RepID=UPI002406A84B|nr:MULTISPECIES: InlB B-repeat-containing protein [unclassified Breznakia]MDF9825077.1 hypothetical protein [Breznakia sp. PM6-1]MDF9835946.1 hypothetical protein [Breznakia sp. PF5-3]MDF9837452.1 hypothetical protein [Breznakia sp. PFB2-8]MDF9859485.1 hypothetical protein [Breznakia sp. PH5-24]
MKKIRKIKIFFLIAIMLFGTILASSIFRASISADDETKVHVNVYSNLYYNNNGNYEDIPVEGLPYEADVVLEIHASTKKEYETVIDYKDKVGTVVYSYYDGVLKIDDRNATQEEYEAFIGNGMSDVLSSKERIYTLHLKSTGEDEGLITCGINFLFRHPSGTIKYLYTLKHKGLFHGETYAVNFYDYDGSVIKSERVKPGTAVEVPTVKREGYNFLGFNTLENGTGEYYKGQEIVEDMSFYAIYEKKIYRVNYYVDDELYTTREVAHGEDAENIKLKDTASRKFVGWDKSLNNVTSDYDVHAVFKTIKPIPSPPKDAEKPSTDTSIKEKEVIAKPSEAVTPKAEIEQKEPSKKDEKKAAKVKAKIKKTSSIEGNDTLEADNKAAIINNDDNAEVIDSEEKVSASVASKEVGSSKDDTLMKLLPFAVSTLSMLVLLLLTVKSKIFKR